MMQHKQGTARDQINFSSFEDRISRDNPVRFIAIFSGKLDLEKIGFSVKTLQKEGHPSFESSLFIRLYLYGYLNGLRSSRKLDKECEPNIELHWLLHGMTPNYHSISDFRKDNPQALKKLFKLFVSFLKNADLICGETIAIDGTKSRAHNSKKANFSQKKINRHMEYIDQKVEEARLQSLVPTNRKYIRGTKKRMSIHSNATSEVSNRKVMHRKVIFFV